MTVLGLDKLKKKFGALPEEMQAAIRLASEQGAQEMVDMAQRLVPVDTGSLKASIAWTHGNPPGGSIGFAAGRRKAGEEVTDRISIYAGDADAYYARWVEFGTLGRPASPFFFPAFRALKKRMRSRNTRAMNKVARKVAAGGN